MKEKEKYNYYYEICAARDYENYKLKFLRNDYRLPVEKAEKIHCPINLFQRKKHFPQSDWLYFSITPDKNRE